MKCYLLICLCCVFSATSLVSAQNSIDSISKQNSYTNVITQRANKIVAVLGISDSVQFKKVSQSLVRQYRLLSALHDSANSQIKIVKAAVHDKDSITAAVNGIELDRTTKLKVLHHQFLSELETNLSGEQIVKVKDGMTYGVLPITVKAYQDMLLTLTPEQKNQIIIYLTEAREFAMDAESSEKKHAWFGKYKGKINNYLSAAGIDMKKAGQEWEERRKTLKTDNKQL